jgi:hypothetical protein
VQTILCINSDIGVDNDCIEKRCTRRLVLTVGRNVRFLLSLMVVGQFTVVSATPNEDRPDGTNLVDS